MKTCDELIPFVNKMVDVRLEDGRNGHGVLRIWEMQGPREEPFVLDPPPAEDSWVHHRRFYAREIADIHLAN